MMELVDIADLKSAGPCDRAGSIPVPVRFRLRAKIPNNSRNSLIIFMVNNQDKFSKKNIIILLVGLIIFAFSFLLIALVGKNPEGILGFLAPFTMLIGIITIVTGFLYKANS